MTLVLHFPAWHALKTHLPVGLGWPSHRTFTRASSGPPPFQPTHPSLRKTFQNTHPSICLSHWSSWKNPLSHFQLLFVLFTAYEGRDQWKYLWSSEGPGAGAAMPSRTISVHVDVGLPWMGPSSGIARAKSLHVLERDPRTECAQGNFGGNRCGSQSGGKFELGARHHFELGSWIGRDPHDRSCQSKMIEGHNGKLPEIIVKNLG